MKASTAIAFWLALVPAAAAQTAPDFGYTRPAAEVRLAFPESGVLRELKVREGRTVAKGEVLARLETAVLEADAEIAQATLELAERRLKTLEGMADAAHVSPDELARARAEAAVERGRVKKVAAQIENRVLRSPVDGVVVEIRREVGESVGPSDFTVMTVVRTAELRSDLYVTPETAAAHKVGQSIEILYDGKTRVAATVDFISPLVDPASGTTRMRLSIPNAEGKLSGGMKVSLAPPDRRP